MERMNVMMQELLDYSCGEIKLNFSRVQIGKIVDGMAGEFGLTVSGGLAPQRDFCGFLSSQFAKNQFGVILPLSLLHNFLLHSPLLTILFHSPTLRANHNDSLSMHRL